MLGPNFQNQTIKLKSISLKTKKIKYLVTWKFLTYIKSLFQSKPCFAKPNPLNGLKPLISENKSNPFLNPNKQPVRPTEFQSAIKRRIEVAVGIIIHQIK